MHADFLAERSGLTAGCLSPLAGDSLFSYTDLATYYIHLPTITLACSLLKDSHRGPLAAAD